MYLQESRFPIIRFNPAIKSMNYLGNMLAKKYCDALNVFEPIFYNAISNYTTPILTETRENDFIEDVVSYIIIADQSTNGCY